MRCWYVLTLGLSEMGHMGKAERRREVPSAPYYATSTSCVSSNSLHSRHLDWPLPHMPSSQVQYQGVACRLSQSRLLHGTCAIIVVDPGKDFAGYWLILDPFPVLVMLGLYCQSRGTGHGVHKHKQLRCHAKHRSLGLHLVWLTTSGGLVRVHTP